MTRDTSGPGVTPSVRDLLDKYSVQLRFDDDALDEYHFQQVYPTVTSTSMWTYEVQAVQAEPCRVYWGTHGCDRPRGHSGIHICRCGEFPYEFTDPSIETDYFGEDVELAAVIALVEVLEVEL